MHTKGNFVLLACAVACVLCQAGPQVKTQYGIVQGFQSGSHNVFLGVPYAAPPVGKLRWQLPQPPIPWNGVLNATEKGPICPQPSPNRAASEDCLSLNIYVPITKDVHALPVYIFIHGGSFWGGNGGDVNGTFLSGNDTVFVSINYRLGVLGFLGLPEMANNSAEYPTYGFFGVQDQRMAFMWVQENIRAFGGNQYEVTIGGQSAGAISVCIHLATPLSKGLFSRAIMESGLCTINTQATVFGLSEMISNTANCTGADRMACMMGKTADELVAADPASPIWPCLNPYEIMQQPVDLFHAGEYNRIPLLVGTNHDEQSFEACPWFGTITPAEYNATMKKVFNGLITDAVLNMYPLSSYSPPVAGIIAAWTDSRFKCPTLEAVAAMSTYQEQPIYMYEFLHVPSWQTDKCMNVTHSTELGFLFPGDNYEAYYTKEEVQLVGWMRDWWTSFIINGVPVSDAAGVNWENFEFTYFNYLAIDVPASSNQVNFEEPYCEFWAMAEPSSS